MLEFPYDAAPEPGETLEIRPGILWTRLALPFRLDHVNVFFLQDDDGWVIVDTGIDNRAGRAQWDTLLNGPLKGFRFTGLLATHHHPDHIGLAGWLCDRLEIPLLTSQATFLSTTTYYNSPELLAATDFSRFYASHGMSAEVAALVSTMGQEYMRMLSKPPFTYRRLKDGDILTLAGRRFEVMSGDGHCPEQLMLHLPEENLFLAADQVIEKISPNVSVLAFEPDGDPLGAFLESLARISAEIPTQSLVLAGHRLPFHGLQERCADLAGHHRERCDIIRDAARRAPLSAADVVPLMFSRPLSPHEMSFAFTEVLAHMNHLVALGDCGWQTGPGGSKTIVTH